MSCGFQEVRAREGARMRDATRTGSTMKKSAAPVMKLGPTFHFFWNAAIAT